MDVDVVLATSTSNMPSMHSVCHLRFFCYWADGNNHFKNDFKKSKISTKSV